MMQFNFRFLISRGNFLLILITVRNSSCGKVMFSQACIIPSVHMGLCVAKGVYMVKGDMHGGWDACMGMAGGMHGKGA